MNHALAFRLEAQAHEKVHRFQQELPGHSHPATQWRVCGVHAVSGEHGPGMFGGSRPEIGVKRGMSAIDRVWLVRRPY